MNERSGLISDSWGRGPFSPTSPGTVRLSLSLVVMVRYDLRFMLAFDPPGPCRHHLGISSAQNGNPRPVPYNISASKWI